MKLLDLLEAGLYAQALEEAEKMVYLAALKHNNGVVSRAAKKIGISRTTLIKKLAYYTV